MKGMEPMYPMPTPQTPPYAPATSLLSRGMIHGGAQQFSSVPLQHGAGQSGGLLAKLFGGAQAGGGGITNIVGMLQNAQKAIGVFQQISPLVQQYGPLIKSLPALISIMRGSGNPDDEESTPNTSDENEKKQDNTGVRKNKEKSKKNKSSQKTQTTSKQKKSPNSKKRNTQKTHPIETSNSIPAPKLYI